MTVEQQGDVFDISYARMNHFVEWLNIFQGRENFVMNDVDFQNIILEISNYPEITDLTQVNIKIIKDILRKLTLHKYFEHIPFILNRITGLPNPIISPEIEEKLKHMFNELQEAYKTLNISMLPYGYTIYKLLGICGEEELMKHIPLLKSREKLHKHEQVWKQICECLGWEYTSCTQP